MTYFLLQSGAMFLAAYFIGCWCGCLFKTLDRTAGDEVVATAIPAASPALAKMPPAAPSPPPRPVPAAVPLAPAVPRPAASPPPGPSPAPGSRVAPVMTAAASAAAAAMVTRPGQMGSDDLKRIKGIGPEIEGKLKDAGIRRYTEIAAWSTVDVARVSGLIGQDGRVQHENWIEQAQILARGGETAFSRRMDRREVADGRAGTWTPTAPGEVARQTASAVQSAASPVAQVVQSRPSVTTGLPPAMGAGTSAAVGAAAAAATFAAARPAPVTPPPAPVTVPSTPDAAARPAGGISMRPTPGSTNQRRFVRLAAPEGKSDDLALISGVGDKVAAELNRYGIFHFWQLSAMGPDDIDYLESRLALRGRMRREEWQEQARELMAGKQPRGAIDRARAAASQAHPQQASMGQEPAKVAPVQTVSPPPSKPAPIAAVTSASPPRPTFSTPSAGVATTAQGGHARPHVTHTQPPVHTPPVKAPAPPAAMDVATAAVASTVAAAATAVPARPATPPAPPVQTVPVQPPPVRPAAVQPAAVQSTPIQAAPVQAAPVQTAPVQVAPIQVAPVQAVPVQTLQAQPQPVQAAPAPVVKPVQAPVAPVVAPAAVAQPVTAAVAGAVPDGSANPNWTPRSRASNTAARGNRDDLKRIKGIGVVIDKKLEALGTTTYAQIAAWTTADIDRVSNALDFKGRIEREQWVEQARILGGGGQTDFSRRMDRSDGGVA